MPPSSVMSPASTTSSMPGPIRTQATTPTIPHCTTPLGVGARAPSRHSSPLVPTPVLEIPTGPPRHCCQGAPSRSSEGPRPSERLSRPAPAPVRLPALPIRADQCRGNLPASTYRNGSPTMVPPPFERPRVLSEANRGFQGLTISEISRRKGTDPETTVMDLVLEERCQATMYRIFKQTDGPPGHGRRASTDDGRDRREGVRGRQPVGRTVQVISKGPRLLRTGEEAASPRGSAAQDDVLCGADHGPAAQGSAARRGRSDITVFDLDTVSAALDGNKCYPRGIEYVALNGQVVLDGGHYERAAAGRVVRKQSAAGAGLQTRRVAALVPSAPGRAGTDEEIRTMPRLAKR